MATIAVAAASVADNPLLLSWMRQRLGYDMDHVMSCVCIRAWTLLRGVRGTEGARWLRTLLIEPSFFKLLSDSTMNRTADTLRELATALVEAHHMEESKRQETLGETRERSRRFSQHREGRHASQSGLRWLAEAATDQGAAALAATIDRLDAIIPGVWSWQPPLRPRQLSGEIVKELFDAVKGCWPMPDGQHAAAYTSMDVTRLYYASLVVLGRVAPAAIQQPVFDAVLEMQAGPTTQMFEQLNMTYSRFRTLERQLQSSVRCAARPIPEWAPAGVAVLWPFIFVHLCECASTCKDPVVGDEGIQRALAKPLTKAERSAVEAKVEELLSVGHPADAGQVAGAGMHCAGQHLGTGQAHWQTHGQGRHMCKQVGGAT